MKANTEKETIRTMQEIIDEVKNTYLDGNVFIAVNYKSDSYVDLINVANGEARFFTCHVRKQGSGKRNKANKIVRLRVANKMLIMEDTSIKEIAEEEMRKHTFVSVMPDSLVHTKCVPVFHSALKSKVRFEYFFNITTSGVEVFKGEEEVADVETAAPVPAEEPAEVETATPAPAETVPSEEDTVIEWLLNSHSKTENPITKGLIERMMNMSSYINKDMLKELDEFDWAYTYAQEICQDYNKTRKDADILTAAAENIDRFILTLSVISTDLKAQAEKAEISAKNCKKSLENISENQVRFHYNGIDCKLSIIEEENNEKKKAEQKVSEIMANLSDVERDLLMKSLGLKPEVEIIEDHVEVPELETAATIDGNKFVIIMNDGNTRSIEKTWSEIAHHLRQVALKKETVNVSICEYVASEMKKGMSRKDLGECLGSKHYAAKILDYCSQLGLYKIDQNLSPRKWSSPEAAAKGAKTRSTLSKIRQKAIDEDLARHAAERRR